MRAHHRHHMATSDGHHDGTRVVRGVEHHHLRIVAHDPNVVVDFPTTTVGSNVPCVTMR